MNPLSRAWEVWGQTTYSLAALASGQLLGLSACLESVLVHRSVAAGDVQFGRSDVDLVLILRPRAAKSHLLAALLRQVRRVQFLNPAMLHREVYLPDSLEEFAARDSVWCSIERRTLKGLYGKPVSLPIRPVDPEHATRRFLVWWEVFFCTAAARRNARNLEKACLECWNYYAVAQGLLAEPLLRRAEMREHLQQSGHPLPGSLTDPDQARHFVLDLAARLHRIRLRPLRPLAQAFAFVASPAPHCVRRRFLVLPQADSPLPNDYSAGDLLATPELLDLLIQRKNAFMHWSVPPELSELGIEAPDQGAFLRDALYICTSHFLFFPGFVERIGPHPASRLRCARHAFEFVSRGELPTPLPQAQLERLQPMVTDAESYYLNEYSDLEKQRRDLSASMVSFQERHP